MKFKILVVGLLVGLLVVASGVMGQDTAVTCKNDFVTAAAPDGTTIMDTFSAQIELMRESAAAGDMGAWLQQSADLRMGLGLAEAECQGLHFSSAGKGLKSIVGPIVLADGLWKASLRTDGIITTATITNVEGDCYEMLPNLFLISQAKLDVAQEALMKTSGGCIAMIEIENVGGTAWDITFEPISLTAP